MSLYYRTSRRSTVRLPLLVWAFIAPFYLVWLFISISVLALVFLVRVAIFLIALVPATFIVVTGALNQRRRRVR